jgi:hypothetical protein
LANGFCQCVIIKAVFAGSKKDGISRFLVSLIVFFCLTGFAVPGDILAVEKPVIGAIEHVIIEPFGVRVDARIDTGASTTSLDARNIKVSKDTVTFNLSPKFGGAELTVPIIAWKHVRTSGSRARRPVVELELCIDGKKLRVHVNLADRSEMRYPLLLGRNVIMGNFVVDPSRSYLTIPSKDCGDDGK